MSEEPMTLCEFEKAAWSAESQLIITHEEAVAAIEKFREEQEA